MLSSESERIAADFANLHSLEMQAQDLQRQLYPLQSRIKDAKRVWKVIDGKPVGRSVIGTDTSYWILGLGADGREGTVRFHEYRRDYQVMMIQPGHRFQDKNVKDREEAHRLAVEWVITQSS